MRPPLLSSPKSLGLSSAGVGFAVGTVYLLGEVAGALFFGRLSDRWGRRNLFVITLGVYLLGGAMTALTLGHGEGWVLYLYLCRFIAGMGIGGEYAAINSAIDELIPSRYRGRVDIAVNGTYWGGALLATLVTLALINNLPVGYSWRIAFLAGPGARLSDHLRAAEPAREPAVAAHAGSGRRGRSGGRRNRAQQPFRAAARAMRSMSRRPSRSGRPSRSASSPWPAPCSPPIRGARSSGHR